MVKYSISHCNTLATHQRTKESLNVENNGLARTTLVYEMYYQPSQWHIAKNATQLCQKMLGNACQYMNFVQCKSQNIQRIEERVPFHQEHGYEFWLCLNDIKHCVNGNNNKYVLDWHITQYHHVACEDRHQCLEGGGVGVGGHQSPIAREGGIVSLSYAFQQLQHSLCLGRIFMSPPTQTSTRL